MSEREIIVTMKDDIPMYRGEEIVRCKDCKHRDPEDGRCDHGAVWFVLRRMDNDYCSYGERKGGGSDE